MNKIIEETDNLMKVQEKIEQVFKEVDEQVNSYKSLEKENNNLWDFIYNLLDKLKVLFRKILLRGDYESQDLVCKQVKDIYDENKFEDKDVYHICRGTEKQDELFEHAKIPDYMKEKIRYFDDEKDRDDGFEIGKLSILFILTIKY